jgi:quercetin dioxygenase-like cupin family protein
MPNNAVTYRWSELPKDVPMPMLERRRVIGEQAMVSHVTLHKGCFVPTHAHVNEQMTCILSGRLKFTLGEETSANRETVMVGPGEMIHLPSNTPHAAEAIEETVVLDIFSPPSATTGIDRQDSTH